MSEQTLSKEKLERIFRDYDDLLYTKDVAKALRTSMKTVYKMLQDGYLQSFKIGGKTHIPKEWVIEYILQYGYINTSNTSEEHRKKVLWHCSFTPKTVREIAVHLGLSEGFCRSVLLQGLCNDGKMKRVFDQNGKKAGLCCYLTVQKKGSRGGSL